MQQNKFAEVLYEKGYKRELSFFLKKNINQLKFFEEKKKDQICIAIHQPAYFGWPGYFHKILYSDKFIILDNVIDQKNSFINRSKILTNDNAKYLTIPIKKKNSSTLINELQIDDTQNWRSKHLNLIYNSYRKSAYFDEIYDFIELIFKKVVKNQLLVEITFIVTQEILMYLNINREIHFSSNLEIDPNLKKEKRNYALVKKLNGEIYFSGITAKNYQESAPLPKNIKLIYQDFWDYFDLEIKSKNFNLVNGLSIIDLLFKFGKSEILNLLDQYLDYSLKKQRLIFDKDNL